MDGITWAAGVNQESKVYAGADSVDGRELFTSAALHDIVSRNQTRRLKTEWGCQGADNALYICHVCTTSSHEQYHPPEPNTEPFNFDSPKHTFL